MFNKEQLQRFSIRKLTVGAASVLIGVLFLTSWNTNTVYADSINVTSGESIAKNNNPQEGNPAVNKDNVQIVDNDSTEVSNISDSKSSKVIKSDATKSDATESDIVRDKTTIDDNSGTKVPELTAQAKNKKALTTVTEDNGAKVSKTEKYNNSDIKNQSKNSEKTQETTLVKKVLEKKVLDKEKLSSESLIEENLSSESLINPKKLDGLDGKVEIRATDPSNTITATDPSNYPKLNGLIGEDKYIYQVLSLEPEYWDSRSKLILSVNRNDPNDNIYAYVIHGNYNYYDGNYDYNSVEKPIIIGKDESSIITIDGRKYRLNNNGSSEVFIGNKVVSTQNSSTVTSKPRYLDNFPISQDYGLGNTSNDNCSAIGEIVPVFTKNSVIKYYYSDNEGHLQEFKNSELPNVSVEGFTGQEFEIDDVDQYKKVIPGYHLKSAPTGNFKGTLSQFSDDKYYKKVYYDFGTNKVKYSVLYHQIYPDGTMEVWLVDGKGDALTEKREIAPNTSTEFSNYNCTVRNPYVTAVQHEVQFIYSPDKQHMTITYVDDTTGETLKTVTKDGVSDGSANYNTKNDIDGYKAQH
ncbi:YSIRK-type signal peptide-containing protein, partial [Lactobacillus amylovorus]